MYFEWKNENEKWQLSKISGIKGIITLIIGKKYGVYHVPKKNIEFRE